MEDAVAAFKDRQRRLWGQGAYPDFARLTAPVARRLVQLAGVAQGQRVLDVGTGTGVVALECARQGAHVDGIDLAPDLLALARAADAGGAVTWREGDVESLPYEDATFDGVLSQFGHIFAPRPDVAAREMLRVLRPEGTLAVAVWPIDGIVGRIFELSGRYVPQPPEVAPMPQWGDPATLLARFGAGLRDVAFERGSVIWPARDVASYRTEYETRFGSMQRLVAILGKDPARLAAYRAEFEALAAPYFRAGAVHQDCLLARGTRT